MGVVLQAWSGQNVTPELLTGVAPLPLPPPHRHHLWQHYWQCRPLGFPVSSWWAFAFEFKLKACWEYHTRQAQQEQLSSL